VAEGTGIEKNLTDEQRAMTPVHEVLHASLEDEDLIEDWTQWCIEPVGAPPGPPECLEETVEVEEGVCEGMEPDEGGGGDGDGDGDGEGGGCVWWTFYRFEWSYGEQQYYLSSWWS